MNRILPNDIQRILIIRPSAMGDIVMASPMLRVLRQAYPAAHICWLVEPSLADLLKHHPDLDDVLLWPKGAWRKHYKNHQFFQLFKEVLRFRNEIRHHRFDLVLDAVGLLKSRLLAWLSGARLKIGFDSKEPGRGLLTAVVAKPRGEKRMSAEYIAMMEFLGLVPGDFQPQVGVSQADRIAARELLGARSVGGPYVVFVPFTTRPQKHWFDERWAELAARVREQLGLPVVILGGPADLAHGEQIRRAGGELVHNLSGASTLGQSAALIEGCALLVGVDTGLTHMGTAFRKPTVALFGATCPYQVTPNALTRVLYHPLGCSPCRRKPTCAGAFTCMQSMSVAQVFDQCKQLLQETEQLP